jgi:hypothetical protein
VPVLFDFGSDSEIEIVLHHDTQLSLLFKLIEERLHYALHPITFMQSWTIMGKNFRNMIDLMILVSCAWLKDWCVILTPFILDIFFAFF